jgi:hypothetical protein
LKVTAVAAGLAFPHAAQAIQIVRRRRPEGVLVVGLDAGGGPVPAGPGQRRLPPLARAVSGAQCPAMRGQRGWTWAESLV